jgi:oryzin
MSFGGGYIEALNLAVYNAYDSGILSVVSAGNSGYNVELFSPASEPTAITVAASDEFNERALFSSWGAGVDIFAAGTNINSTYFGDKDVSAIRTGTSMSASHVSGLALYLKALEGGLELPWDITDRIKKLGTRDALTSVPQETVNLLAYNGVHGY